MRLVNSNRVSEVCAFIRRNIETAKASFGIKGPNMKSYINMILDSEGAKERLASSLEMVGRCVRGSRLAAQGGSLTIEASVWLVSYMLAILGLVKAAYSEQPLLWLAVWPAPIVLVSTIFIFSRQGFHCRDGLFVLGRRER